MAIQAINWAFEQNVHPAGRKFVLVALANFANDEGCAFPGQETLARMTGQSPRTVRKHLRDLEADGWITRKHRYRRDGTRTSDFCILNFVP